MIARRTLLGAAAVLPVVAGLAAAPLAWADSEDEPDNSGRPHSRVELANEVLTGTLAAAGTSYQDAAGNSYVEGAQYTGSATGTIAGTFRSDLNVFTPAGSTRSRFWGSIAISNGATPPNVVFGTVSGEQAPATTGFSDTGRFALDGGVGTYLGAHSQGSLKGVSTATLNAAGSIKWTLNSASGEGSHPENGNENGNAQGNGKGKDD